MRVGRAGEHGPAQGGRGGPDQGATGEQPDLAAEVLAITARASHAALAMNRDEDMEPSPTDP